MRKRFYVCVVTAGALLALAALNAGQAGKTVDDEDKFFRDLSAMVRQLRDPDPHVRARINHRIDGIYSIVVTELEQIARTTGHEYDLGSAEHYAVGLLGRWRARQACGMLVHNIEIPCPSGRISANRRLGLFPSAQALIEMRSPAAEDITDWLSMSPGPASDRRLRLFGFVIHATEGEKLGLARLELALDEVKKRRAEPRYRALGDMPEKNLSRMIEVFRTVDFKDRRQVPRP